MKIQNTLTNIVGRTKTERMVSLGVWQSEILPQIHDCFKAGSKIHKVQIGKWFVELHGNDEHMHEFFVKNWKPAGAQVRAEIHCYVITGLKDKEAMMKFLGLRGEEQITIHRDQLLKALEDKKFRASIKDPKLSKIESFSDAQQKELALFAPATVYCAEAQSFLTLNTNYYGQLKSKSSLGPLEEFLIRKAKINSQGGIENPNEVWLSMHAGCNEYVTATGKSRGVVIIAPTGTGKSTHGYGLVEAKKENKLHSDDWVFVNLKTREVLTSEEHFYMRTNIVEIYPHLIPLLVNEPLENVALTPESVALLETFSSPKDLEEGIRDGRVSRQQYENLTEQMIANNSARSLIDPRIMVGDKFTERVTMTDIFLMKRDYDDVLLVQRLTPEEVLEILTSPGNVFNYAYGKLDADGYGIAQSRTTEIYYNPYLCVCEVESSGKVGELDKIRLEAYKTLASCPEVRSAWMNTRLPAGQMQQCIRKYLEDDYTRIEVLKGEKVTDNILTSLRLIRRAKEPVEGRRKIDLVGFYDPSGVEVEVVGFYKDNELRDVQSYPKPTPKKSA